MDSIKIDWSKPIEAVHADGRIVSVETWGGVDYSGDCVTKPKIDGVEGIWRSDGTPWGADYSGRETIKHWRLRNTPSATPTRTALEQRMEDLVRRMADDKWDQSIYTGGILAEARAIVAELPEPVDGDLLEARKVFADWYLKDGDKKRALQIHAGEYDKAPTLDMIKTALLRGRALERGE
jgi:hypothetical protein